MTYLMIKNLKTILSFEFSFHEFFYIVLMIMNLSIWHTISFIRSCEVGENDIPKIPT